MGHINTKRPTKGSPCNGHFPAAIKQTEEERKRPPSEIWTLVLRGWPGHSDNDEEDGRGMCIMAKCPI